MRFIYILLLSSIVPILSTFGQEKTKLSQMQGIWECLPDTVSYTFRIVKENKCLSFYYLPGSPDSDFLVSESTIGFQNLINSTTNGDEDAEEIYVDSIKAEGLYFTEIEDEKYIDEDGLIAKPYFFVPYYFECDEEMLSICGGKLFDYERIPKLSYDVTAHLYYRGKKDKRDYIKEYIGIEVVELVKNCTAYEKPEKGTSLQLKQGAVLVIAEDIGKWVRVDCGVDSSVWIVKKNLIKAISDEQ